VLRDHWAHEIPARACFRGHRALGITAWACFRCHCALEITARVCFRGHFAVEIIARAAPWPLCDRNHWPPLSYCVANMRKLATLVRLASVTNDKNQFGWRSKSRVEITVQKCWSRLRCALCHFALHSLLRAFMLGHPLVYIYIYILRASPPAAGPPGDS
jgi:hypothetical protein